MGTKNTAVRNGLAQWLSDALDTGTGTLEIGTSGWAGVLATWDINATQTTGVTTGVWTIDFDSDGVTASGSGTAAVARLRDSGTPTYEIDSLSVGLTSSGDDIELDSVNITSGQTVTLTSATWTVPAATA